MTWLFRFENGFILFVLFCFCCSISTFIDHKLEKAARLHRWIREITRWKGAKWKMKWAIRDSPLCIRLCIFNVDRCENRFEQISHSNGRSPVCVRWWIIFDEFDLIICIFTQFFMCFVGFLIFFFLFSHFGKSK